MAAATVDLRALVSEQAEFLSGRLRELVSSGQGLVRAQFGLDLGLKPELYPGWMVLSTAAAGLLLLGALSWAALCGALLPGKQRGSPVLHPAGGGGGGGGGGTGGEPIIKPQHFIKNAKPEEQKKRNKKKSTGDIKKVQSNGGVVVVSPEEVNVSETAVSKPSPEIKAEKVQQATTTLAKKNKRKARAEGKPTQNDGKEDDGAWETKVSSREKRQQRRKDKGPEDSGSPGTAEGSTGHGEPPAVTNSRKHRESQQRRSSGKGDAGSAPASSGWREEPAMAGGLEGEKWSGGSSASRHRAQPESTQCWGQETTQGFDSRMKADLNPVSFSMLGLNSTESQPIDLQWDRHPDVSDEWSGFNGMAAVDSSSDWNAPAEHWGNYEEPPVLATPAAAPKEQVSEDEKEGEDPTDGTAKSKKKKKKKNKAEDDTQTVSEAPPITPSSQKKTEQTKKKVRRET